MPITPELDPDQPPARDPNDPDEAPPEQDPPERDPAQREDPPAEPPTPGDVPERIVDPAPEGQPPRIIA